MAKQSFPASSWLLCLSLAVTLLGNYSTATEAEKKVYIVYMGDLPKGDFSASANHVSMLQEIVGSAAAAGSSLLYSYKRSFNGFVAKLSDEEMQKVKGMEGVVSVFPSEKKQLHTTKSWDFTGLSQSAKRATVESNIVVGMLDTGIWPESASFSDQGFGPPPTTFKGSCSGLQNFTCNNKIIGAKFYRADGEVPVGDFASPRDSEGHGSHTSSTAAGREVTEASLLGLAAGTVRGGVPSSRIAVYKICWSDGCADADILAAFDDAIADGVDIISISVGGSFAIDYFEDPIAIGAFHSMRNNILTSNSGGNSGPGPASITNVSPWSLSVAASTIDRKFVTNVGLGNGKVYEGISVNTFTLQDNEYPLIYGGDAPNTGVDGEDSRYCGNGTLDKELVSGKIVLCDELSLADGAVTAGAIGTVMADTRLTDVAFTFQLPATYISVEDGGNISLYINTTSQATATIFKSIEAKNPSAPFVVSFSSRGPNPITTDILKPDIAAPGVDILAAWSEATTVTGSVVDKRVVSFNILSGTSMACPHATGAVAYIKSFHPTWSPAALKSALMTTATTMSVSTNSDAEFAYGSGNINPVKAVSPGLVYDAGEADYIKMLCGQGYSTKKLQIVTGDKSTCSEATNGTVWDLNYPSFALDVTSVTTIQQSFNRTVTNVGSPGSVYKATVIAPSGITIQVTPNVLSFGAMGQKQSFVLTVGGNLKHAVGSGSLVWDDGVYQVRSPIVVYTEPQGHN